MVRFFFLIGVLMLMMLPLSALSTTTARLEQISVQFEIALQTVEEGLTSLELQLAIAESQLSGSNQELNELRIELKALRKEAASLKAHLLQSQIAHSELERVLNSAETRMKSLEDSFESYKKKISGEIQKLLRKERGKRILWGIIGVGIGTVLGLLLN